MDHAGRAVGLVQFDLVPRPLHLRDAVVAARLPMTRLMSAIEPPKSRGRETAWNPVAKMLYCNITLEGARCI